MLEELKIIDVSTVLAGPSVGTFFAELGATVIKVENALLPDVTRSWKLQSEDKKNSVSAYFSSVNYKKNYKQLNLKYAKDHVEFLELVKDADILLSNFKYGDEAKLNLEDDFLRTINPRLIRGKISGFGSDSDRVAYDLILQAETGYMSMNGTPESGPVKMPVAFIDVLAAHQLKEGLLLALMERMKTGKARTVSVSLYDAAVCSLVNQASNYLMEGHIPKRQGSLHPNIAPYGELFTSKDGDQLTFAIGSNAHFQKLCHFLGLDSLIEHPDYSENVVRVAHRIKLKALLQEKISLYPTSEILNYMLEQHVPVGKINNLQEVFSEEAAQKLVREEEIEEKTTKRVTSLAFQIS